ncbi:MAG TPA: PQQ-dependent sugar dehydrogenase, partial [Actinomycetota bacterium]|nr:PQQ-dependent sugar dehydrogenase [Actinomycetota bacterium]
PVAMATRPGDPTLYVAQKTGKVVALRDGGVSRRPAVDLTGEVSLGGEQGLLGLAFSPDCRFLYVNYTDLAGDTHVTEYVMGATGDPGSAREVLRVGQPFPNHNGGNLAFGPDGYLYIGLGDGGLANDPQNRAESLDDLLGKMLRVDPRPSGGGPYAIPPDNPFVGEGDARPEIWAYGLRNPWRYSFDRETGDLWIADVGQNAREEVNVQPAASTGGEHYGWDGFEGTMPFEPPFPEDAVPPVYDYGRELGATVIGGFVYRGAAIPALRGAYVFGDFYEPALRALVVEEGRLVEHRRLGPEVEALSSFGEDQQGELYALSLSGPVYRLAAREGGRAPD